ncbi:MAG: type 4a pilus biogenesis protein PilO [Myxococcales bacterium]|nr:type 4a pilus biogenesis protein PilO [Myxococcales bacterium]MDP3504583.1 type 4a pilus biogenesis protein PilO [Myxococcales bacterium]
MEQLLERVNKLPIAAKAGIIVGVIVLITAGTWFLVIQDTETAIESLKSQQVTLDQTYAEKKEIADNLLERRREMDQLEQKLQDALTELPERKDIDELLAALNDLGKKAGLEITRVVPGVETSESFFARIPIVMAVKGNYHEIAVFLQEISQMKRIVNVNNLKLGTPTNRNDKVILTSDFLATTFRFITQKPTPAGAPGGAQ